MKCVPRHQAMKIATHIPFKENFSLSTVSPAKSRFLDRIMHSLEHRYFRALPNLTSGNTFDIWAQSSASSSLENIIRLRLSSNVILILIVAIWDWYICAETRNHASHFANASKPVVQRAAHDAYDYVNRSRAMRFTLPWRFAIYPQKNSQRQPSWWSIDLT